MILVTNMLACIAFDVQVVPQIQDDTAVQGTDSGFEIILDTADDEDTSLDTDTEDTEETDTQETDTPDGPDDYTSENLMLGSYLELKNDLYLSNKPELGVHKVCIPNVISYVSITCGVLRSV